MFYKGIRVLDPACDRDATVCAELCDGVWREVYSSDCPNSALNGSGLILAPGLWDVHVHFRDPGNPAAETTETGLAAAEAGGFRHVVTMPNTSPACDNAELIARQKGNEVVELLPSSCITQGRSGRSAIDFESVLSAGAAAFTDDGSYVESDEIMRAAMRFAAAAGIPVMDHAVVPTIAGSGVIRECEAARRFGLAVFPDEAETKAVERDIALCEETGARLDIQHISSARTVQLLREARLRGVNVTGEATPHHLALCTADIVEDDAAHFKMNPPLGTNSDMMEIRRGVLDGTLRLFATDHAPHTAESKAKGFSAAPFGIIGLETALGVTWRIMVDECAMKPLEFIRRWTQGPAELLGRSLGSVFGARKNDYVLIDTRGPFKVDASSFKSLSRNCPFADWQLPVRALPL